MCTFIVTLFNYYYILILKKLNDNDIEYCEANLIKILEVLI